MTNTDASELRERIATETGRRPAETPSGHVAGGCINECLRWETDSGPLFVKLTTADRHEMFAAEADALCALAATGAVRVPGVIGRGVSGGSAFLALEWIDLTAGPGRAERRLGVELAALHRATADEFGWHRDNTIGSTHQDNGWSNDWARFFATRRLGFQLDLAEQQGHDSHLVDTGRRLCERTAGIIGHRRITPSLLHGDLWSGNRATDAAGAPVIFDPASYYGDREADIAMTRLFGGFGCEFYAAYESAWALEAGAETRATLYNLYHVLNHLNLFGGGYRRQAQAMIDRLLAETGS